MAFRNRFDGKTALLTGSAAALRGEQMGFGGCTAWQILEEGGKVAITDVRDDLGNAAAEQMRRERYEALYCHLDVTDEDQWRHAVDRTIAELDGVDVLVNIAGILDRENLYDVDVTEWKRVMDVSATGVFLGTRAVLPSMRARGNGAIVNLSSMAGKFAGEYGSAYAFSRAGMTHFTRASAIQLAKFGIRVNSVSPGWIHTPFTDSIYRVDSEREWRAERVPLGRWGSPQEVANGICFLASDEASYITGAEILIDGGVTAGVKGNTATSVDD